MPARAESGIASVYSGEKTANGEYAHATAFTAAHRTLPFGTFVEVTNTRLVYQSSADSARALTITIDLGGSEPSWSVH